MCLKLLAVSFHIVAAARDMLICVGVQPLREFISVVNTLMGFSLSSNSGEVVFERE